MSEFKCEHCGKEFDQSASLQQHVRDKHTQPQPAAEPHPHSAAGHQHEAHHPGHPHHEGHVDHAHQHPHAGGKVRLKISKTMLYAAILVVVIGVGGYGAYAYIGGQPSQPQDQDASVPTAQLGALGSNHIHADIAVYMEGEAITPFGPRHYVRSPYMHVEAGPGEGYVLHMHAVNSPLSIFFRSIGMTFNSECFRLDNGREYCNDGAKSLKMFVKHEGGQWEESRQFHTYIFRDLDKILITYGNESPDQISQQQDSVTDSSIDNADRQMDLGRIAG